MVWDASKLYPGINRRPWKIYQLDFSCWRERAHAVFGAPRLEIAPQEKREFRTLTGSADSIRPKSRTCPSWIVKEHAGKNWFTEERGGPVKGNGMEKERSGLLSCGANSIERARRFSPLVGWQSSRSQLSCSSVKFLRQSARNVGFLLLFYHDGKEKTF